MTEINQVFEQLREIQRQNERYEYSRKKLESALPEIASKLEELQKLVAEIDPTMKISVKQKSYVKYDEILKEFYDMMVSGTHITRKLIETKHPDFGNSQILYTLASLEKMASVKKAKDGLTVRLYI